MFSCCSLLLALAMAHLAVDREAVLARVSCCGCGELGWTAAIGAVEDKCKFCESEMVFDNTLEDFVRRGQS